MIATRTPTNTAIPAFAAPRNPMADRQLLMPEARVEAAEPLTTSLQDTKSDPGKVHRAPQGRRTKHPDLDRDRTYALRDSELKTLTDIGTFRVLKLDDLVAHRYGGDPAEARRDLDNLMRQGLILRRTTTRRRPSTSPLQRPLTASSKRPGPRTRSRVKRSITAL